jgi:G3E family GTPase
MKPAIGMTVIGGFLGAGKTTLVNHILRQTKGRRIGVLVNDFGAVNIDAELIEAREGETIRLANGCLCCGLGDDLARALIKVLGQAVKPEHLLIEASGVAEPWRIAELALAAPEFGAARIIVLADAAAVTAQLADRYIGDLAASQIGCADLLILNKADLLAPDDLRAVIDRLAARWPELVISPSQHAMIEIGTLGLGGPGQRLRAHAVMPDAEKIFRAFRFAVDQKLDRHRVEALMKWLPDWVVRLKAIVHIEGEASPQLVQAASGRWSIQPLPRLMLNEAVNQIVVIGLQAKADPAALRELFCAHAIDLKPPGSSSPGA